MGPRTKRAAAAAVFLTAGALGGAALATPGLFHSTNAYDISVKTCLDRARAALASEKFPVKKTSGREVAGWNDDTIISAVCQRIGGKTIGTVSAAGRDARGWHSVVETGIRKGGPFD